MIRIACVAALCLTACNSAPDALTADEVLTNLSTEIAGYESWGQHADFTGITESAGSRPHTVSHVEVWFNPTMLDALNSTASEFPVGSISVKRGYSDETGADPGPTWAYWKTDDWTDSEWFWAGWNADGSTMVSGSPGACTGCHDAGIDGASLAVVY